MKTIAFFNNKGGVEKTTTDHGVDWVAILPAGCLQRRSPGHQSPGFRLAATRTHK